MYRLLATLVFAVGALPAAAQTQPASPPSNFYPSPPTARAPTVEQGVPIGDLKSPLADGQSTPKRTTVDSEAEVQLLGGGLKLKWGRHAKGAKPADIAFVRQGGLWTMTGRIAAGDDWLSIDGVVERIAAKSLQVKGEVAFRVAGVEKGNPCRISGTLHFKRSGKSQAWRLVEGDNPCDGTQEKVDLVQAKPAEKKQASTQPRRG
ncbi:MAG: hypothetical protein KIT25_01680 [Enhydrobacter sp.]|nr:MAG: hypothetical protein KIT25_01680 [Enhydrobacter sp.]